MEDPELKSYIKISHLFAWADKWEMDFNVMSVEYQGKKKNGSIRYGVLKDVFKLEVYGNKGTVN